MIIYVHNEWIHSRIQGELKMKVKELIELLQKADPDMEVAVVVPDSGYYTAEYHDYEIDESSTGIVFGKFSIYV